MKKKQWENSWIERGIMAIIVCRVILRQKKIKHDDNIGMGYKFLVGFSMYFDYENLVLGFISLDLNFGET